MYRKCERCRCPLCMDPNRFDNPLNIQEDDNRRVSTTNHQICWRAYHAPVPLSQLWKDLQEDFSPESSPALAHWGPALSLQLARLCQEVHQVRIFFGKFHSFKKNFYLGRTSCTDTSEFTQGRENTNVVFVERAFRAVTT